MGDHPVIFRELGDLIKFPNLTVARGLAKKDKRLALAVRVIIDFNFVDSYRRHRALQVLVS